MIKRVKEHSTDAISSTGLESKRKEKCDQKKFSKMTQIEGKGINDHKPSTGNNQT